MIMKKNVNDNVIGNNDNNSNDDHNHNHNVDDDNNSILNNYKL